MVVENELALMDGVWFPVALPWPCFRGQISSKGKKKGWESQRLLGIGSRGGGQAIGRVFIPAVEGICNLRVQDF